MAQVPKVVVQATLQGSNAALVSPKDVPLDGTERPLHDLLLARAFSRSPLDANRMLSQLWLSAASVKLVPKADDFQNYATPFAFGTCLVSQEDLWIDEPLPRLPLATQAIRVNFRVVGRGQPRTDFEIETDLLDDDL